MLLGDPGLRILPFVVGCWAWGDDKGVWGWDHTSRDPSYNAYDRELNEQSILGAFEASLQHGVMMFDTAEAYGTGLSETLTGGMVVAAQQQGTPALVATKFMPYKWKHMDVAKAMPQAVEESLRRLGVCKIDLYQIHNPGHPSGIAAQAHALADVYLSGKAASVGVSNFSVKELKELLRVFRERGVPLASNQIEFSLLRQIPLQDGMLKLLRDSGAQLLAYSPLGMGRLTGKYSARNQPEGRRGFGNIPWPKLQPLVDELGAVGQRYGKSPGQVALNWVLCQGAIPIAGAKNEEQARENAGAMGWRLQPSDVQNLTRLGQVGGYSNWQHG